ncbi:MAG: hypothetical protein D6761_11565 [Candidatus Dadabacteria bacterium]|nr:MAG: hypothetical protein D6761_11565 [Candidatus Dadabacteria bacterium]
MNGGLQWEWTRLTPLAMTMVALAVLLVIWVTLREDSPARTRWTSLMLRGIVIAWFAAAALGLATWSVTWEVQPGHYLIVRDDSASVRLRPDIEQQIDAATDQLKRSLGELGTVEVMHYIGQGQADRWEPAPVTTAGGPTTLLRDLSTLPGDRTAIDAVIVLSDGADESLSFASDSSATADAVLLPEATSPPAPVLLERVEADAYALVRSPLRFRVQTRRQSTRDGRNARIRIRSEGRTLAEQALAFSPGALTTEVLMDVLPVQEGREVFTVEIIPEQGEVIDAFQRTRIPVRVIRDRVRVLHVVGRPSWESRLLREHLRSDPAIDLISFQILRTTRDRPAAPNDELSLIPFPTKELFSTELPRFDVVLFQNFNYQPYFDPAFRITLLENLRRFVVDDGGGFAMLAGDLSFGFGHYHATPLRDILPVSWLGFGGWRGGPLRVRPGPDSDWFGVPPPSSVDLRRVYDVSAARDSRVVWQAGDQPLFVVGRAGRGRAAALMTDELWRIAYLGSAADRTAIAAFWSEMVRYLAGDPDFTDLQVRWEPPVVLPGAPLHGALQPHGSADLVDASGQPITHVTDHGSGFRMRAPTRPGIYRIRDASRTAPQPLIVQYPLEERVHWRVDWASWRDWARSRHVLLASLQQADSPDLLARITEQSRRITRRDFVPVQESPWFWLIGVLLLIGEIAWRRFSGAP